MSNILLVDGSPLMRNSVGERLRAAGHVVRDACDAREAKELLNESAVDVVVLEPHLPGGDGIKLLTTIRTDPLTKILPVIIYTASDDAKFLNDARRLKADKIIHKDQCGFEDIQRAIEEVAEASSFNPHEENRSRNGDGDSA